MTPLSDVSSRNGAPMGRGNSINEPEYPVEFEIERLRWVDGDYDQGGAYWGGGEGDYIFRAQGESADCVEEMFVRAKTLEDAKAQILETYKSATFADSVDLEAFYSSYVEAALFSSSNDRYQDDRENESEFLDDSAYDLSEEAEANMRAACAKFLLEYGDLVRQAAEQPRYSIEMAGHDFWLTRNGHGAGFWDRGLGDIGKKLTEASRDFGGVDLMVGDDNKIYAYGEVSATAAEQEPAASQP